MKRRILCPTDFSQASLNATEYAARLAKRVGADITLLHVQTRYLNEGLDLFTGQPIESMQEAQSADRVLEETCSEITRSFGVACVHEVVTSLGTFEKQIAGQADRYDLTVIGSNGADTAFQFYFGSHSYRIANRTDAAVLVVPPQCTYTDPSVVVFVSDSRPDDGFRMDQLAGFLDTAGASVLPLFVSDTGSGRSHDDYSWFREAIGRRLENRQLMPAERLASDDAASDVFGFLARSRADIVALHVQHHGMLYEVAHASLARKIASGSTCPVFLFHR